MKNKYSYSFLNDEWKWIWYASSRTIFKYGILYHKCDFGGMADNQNNEKYCRWCNKPIPIFIRLFIGKKLYG